MDTVNLTNCNLDDSDIEKLCFGLKQLNHKIGILKLAKNKISDNGLRVLVKSIDAQSSIHTLNLTSNLCTNESMAILYHHMKNCSLKNIYLNHNKISAA